MADSGEEKKKKRAPGQKRRGLGGLSAEKKKLLKKLIMQKAADDLKAEAAKAAEEKKKIIQSRVKPLDIEGKQPDQLEKTVKELHKRLVALEEEKYDIEFKLRRQDMEINQLNLKVNDVKGKFVKPVLKKISKTESKMAKFSRMADMKNKMGGFRDQLKSTGKSKYALEDEDEEQPEAEAEAVEEEEEEEEE